MHRRRFLTLLIFALLLPSVARAAERKPNIVFIIADDLGWGDVGFNGQQKIKTPSLDRLAAEGIVFNQHYAGSTVCLPSRCALLTGKHMGHATARGNPGSAADKSRGIGLFPEDVTVAEELKRAGYTNAIMGKWGLAEAGNDAGMPLNQGFDLFFGYRGHGAAHHYYPDTLWRNDKEVKLPGNDPWKRQGQYAHDLVTEEALKFVDAQSADNPFFLYLAYTIPHKELTVPQDSKEPYLDQNWPKRSLGKNHPNAGYQNDDETNTAYAGMVSRMDRDIGRLMEALKAKGVDENTLVIFTSDNGPEYDDGQFFDSNGPLRGKKRDLYEGGIRVPFVARWPGKVPAGKRSDHVSAGWDFLPTACALAGVEPTDKTIDGLSYLPDLVGDEAKQTKHDYLYWEFTERGAVQAVRIDNWKGVKFVDGPLELYDLSKDLGESTNVAEANPDVAAKVVEIMKTARTDNSQFPLKARNPNAQRRRRGAGAADDAE